MADDQNQPANDPNRYKLGADDLAHGAHGKGNKKSAERKVDDAPVDTGDDRQAQTPDPQSFAKNAEGRMGGPGWGSEAAGGSSIDKRPPG